MSISVADILKKPNALALVQEASKALEAEQKRRAEFREWISEDIKAEFINGEVVIHSPAKLGHIDATGNLCDLLKAFVLHHKLGKVTSEKSMVVLTRNDYEPDICFWSTEKAAHFNRDTMLFPSPDLIVEVLSKSTQRHDRKTKFEDYAEHGVLEYWMVDTKRQLVETFLLLTPTDKSYVPNGKFGLNDELASTVVKDFVIPVKAIFDDEVYLEVLMKILASATRTK